MTFIIVTVVIFLFCWGIIGLVFQKTNLPRAWDGYNWKQKLFATFISGPVAWVCFGIVFLIEIIRLDKFIGWLIDTISNFNKKMLERLK